MSQFDKDLREALGPEQAPTGFADRVLGRTAELDASEEAVRRWGGLRPLEWMGVAAVALLAVGVTVTPILLTRDVEAPPIEAVRTTPPPTTPREAALPQPAVQESPQRAVRLPGLPTAKELFDNGIAAMSARDFRAAAGFFQQASELIPNEHVVFANLAEALHAANRFDEAIAAFRKAIELSPINAGYYRNLSLILVRAGKFGEAGQVAQKAAELDPSSAAQVYFNLGAVLVNRGRHQEAAAAFNKSIEFDPFKAEAIYQLGVTYMASPETLNQAGPLFARFLALRPEGPDADAARGYLEDLKKMMFEAEMNRELRKKVEGLNFPPK